MVDLKALFEDSRARANRQAVGAGRGCSRREAEKWIAAGRVKVDGAVLTGPAVWSPTPAGSRSTARRCRRWRRRACGDSKKRGLVTTDRDPDGRPTVFSAYRRICHG